MRRWSRSRLLTVLAAGAGGLALAVLPQLPASADGGGGLPPAPPACLPADPGMTQVAFPPGATPPVLPYGQTHVMTNEHADKGIVFTQDDGDVPAALKRHWPTGTYNTVSQGVFGNLYRATFTRDDVRQATFRFSDGNDGATIHRLTALSASGEVLAASEWQDWRMRPGAYGSYLDHSFNLTVRSASTPIKSVVFTQANWVGGRADFSVSVWCADFGTPAPVTPPPTTPTTPTTTTPTTTTPPAPSCTSRAVTADADAWFEQASTANKGDDSALAVQSKSGGDAFRAAVRFPLPAIPPGCEVDAAELRLFAEGPTDGRTIDVQRLASAWSEPGITWATQPATTGPVASTASGAAKGWRAWAVGEQVRAMYASGAAHGFLVRDRNEAEDAKQAFNSRESSLSRSTLVVTFRSSSTTTTPTTTTPTTPTTTTPTTTTTTPTTPTTTTPTTTTPTTPTASCPTRTATANADAWFEQASPSSNKGDDATLSVQGKTGEAFRALVRFALPAIPAGCVVSSAELRLWNEGPTSGRTIQVQRAAAAWSETGVTWASQPATTGAIATAASGSSKGWRSWAVADHVRAMYAANAAHGFLVRDANETGDAKQGFFAREAGSNRPTLVVTYRPAG